MRDEINQIQPRDILLLQKVHGMRILFAEDGHQHIGASDFFLPGGLHMQNRALDDPLETQCRLGFAIMVFGDNRRVLFDKAGEFQAQCFKLSTTGP